jgi:DNA (cytosine-5)-methyltransferase 1
MKTILNLYAGLGGNRKHWNGNVTAVEWQDDIAAAYQSQYPDDEVIVGDAHEYLMVNFDRFDFIWSSPPCQSHSKMDRANSRNRKRYADLKLYEEILFLKTYHKGKWVVENVVPYYEPLIPPTTQVGRHLFWSNFDFVANDVARPKDFIASGSKQASAQDLKDWLGLSYKGNIYYGKNHCPAQVLRNCVHPEIGRQILAAAFPETATRTEDGWICNICGVDIFAGCPHDHNEWQCAKCGEWTYPSHYDPADGCQHCGGKHVEEITEEDCF